MKLSTRVRYGVRAMVELAKQPDNKPIPLRLLAENQQISPKYLEQMASSLKIAGLLESIRGADGGYRISKPAEKITVWDIYKVLDISVQPADCFGANCSRAKLCSVQKLWMELADSIAVILKSYNLKDLAQRELKLQSKTNPSRVGGRCARKIE